MSKKTLLFIKEKGMWIKSIGTGILVMLIYTLVSQIDKTEKYFMTLFLEFVIAALIFLAWNFLFAKIYNYAVKKLNEMENIQKIK